MVATPSRNVDLVDQQSLISFMGNRVLAGMVDGRIRRSVPGCNVFHFLYHRCNRYLQRRNLMNICNDPVLAPSAKLVLVRDGVKLPSIPSVKDLCEEKATTQTTTPIK
jgi:hypothetical protein